MTQTTGASVLFIDDDEDLSSALARMLTGAGYRVRCAASADAGVRLAAAERPDLVILDLLMPEKDGFAAEAELRGLAAMDGVPILALTAFGRHIGELHGPVGREASHAFVECLEKPVEPNVLLERMGKALAQSRP